MIKRFECSAIGDYYNVKYIRLPLDADHRYDSET